MNFLGFVRKKNNNLILVNRGPLRYSPQFKKGLIAGQKWSETNGLTSCWFQVSTHLKNMSQIGPFPQVGVKIKNIWNHHLV